MKKNKTGRFETLKRYLLGTSMGLICLVVLTPAVRADTITDASGVKYTLTSDFVNEGTTSAPIFDVTLVIDSSSLTGDTLIAVAPQFQLNGSGIASGVTVESVTSGTWSSPLTPGSTNSGGCMSGGASAGFFCSSGSAATGGTITFVFDVSTATGGTLSTSSDIKAVILNAAGGLADQTSQGITIQNGVVPEPISLSLVGGGLLALGLFRKRLPRR